MGIQALPSQRHDANVLTSHFQINGQLETTGPVGNFLNDPSRTSLSFYDVRLAPLTPGSPLRGIARPHVVLLKPHIMFFYLSSQEARESIRTFVRTEPLMIYTSLAVCRGNVPLPAEARIADFLNVVPGELIPILDAQIYPFVDLPVPFPKQLEMVLLGRSHLLFYHPA